MPINIEIIREAAFEEYGAIQANLRTLSNQNLAVNGAILGAVVGAFGQANDLLFFLLPSLFLS